MELQRKATLTMVGLACGAMLTLLAVPATRWIIVRHVAMQLPFAEASRYLERTELDPDIAHWSAPWGAYTLWGDPRAERRHARRNPGDYMMQLGVVTTGHTEYTRIRALESRFPNNPSLYGNALRHAMERPTIGRPDLEGPWRLAASARSEPSSRADPAVVAAVEHDAVEGERLDPDNGFFPWMRAWSAFARGRDAEALAAIRRAGGKTRWEDYCIDEPDARLRLAEATTGTQSAWRRIVVNAALLYPQYAPARHMARMATTLALRTEQEGRIADSIAIRGSVMRCGALMRSQSRSLIGTLVGIAITAIASTKPDQLSRGNRPKGMTSDQWRELRKEAYCEWIATNAEEAEAAWARAEFAAGKAVTPVVTEGIARWSDPLAPIVDWWMAGALCLANAAWLLALGMVAGWIARLPMVRERKPLSWPVRIGAAVGIGLGSAGAFALIPIFADIAGSGSDPEAKWMHYWAYDLDCIVAFITAIAAAYVAFPSSRKVPAIRAAVIVCLALTGLLASFCALSDGSRSTLTMLAATSLAFGLNDAYIPRDAIVTIAVGASFLPALMLVVCVASLVRRVPVAAGLVHGMRAVAKPIACALVLLFAAITVGTARQEAISDIAIKRQSDHEGRYYATLVGRQWPGPIPAPPLP